MNAAMLQDFFKTSQYIIGKSSLKLRLVAQASSQNKVYKSLPIETEVKENIIFSTLCRKEGGKVKVIL